MRVYEKTLRGCEVEILPMDQHGNLTIKIKPLLLGKGEPLELKVSPESAIDMIGPLAVAAKDAMQEQASIGEKYIDAEHGARD